MFRFTFFFKSCVLIIPLSFFSEPCFATKCFKATNLAELISDFPVVIRGKVIARRRVIEDEKKFLISVRVEKILKGSLDVKEFEVSEVHGVDRSNHWRSYDVEKSYNFPIVIEKGIPRIVLPSDGCARLPEKLGITS